MSLCLALLLAAIAIDWWNGWKPFTRPFQMPENLWLKRFSTIHSKRRRSSPRSVVDAREPPSARLGGSRPQPAMWLRGRVRVHRPSTPSSSSKASRRS
jgi:hypothetical protein